VSRFPHATPKSNIARNTSNSKDNLGRLIDKVVDKVVSQNILEIKDLRDKIMHNNGEEITTNKLINYK